MIPVKFWEENSVIWALLYPLYTRGWLLIIRIHRDYEKIVFLAQSCTCITSMDLHSWLSLECIILVITCSIAFEVVSFGYRLPSSFISPSKSKDHSPWLFRLVLSASTIDCPVVVSEDRSVEVIPSLRNEGGLDHFSHFRYNTASYLPFMTLTIHGSKLVWVWPNRAFLRKKASVSLNV